MIGAVVFSTLLGAVVAPPADVETCELVPVGEPIGTAHPFVVEQIDPHGRWVVLCQARKDTDGSGSIKVGTGFHGDLHGDDMTPYLVRGSGPGEPIDAWVATSGNGDAFAVMRDAALVVLSAEHDEVLVDLSARGADTRALDGSVVWCAAFDADGTRVAWVRGLDDESDLVVTDLRDGTDTVLPLDGALVESFAFDASVDALTALVISHDTNNDGGVARPLFGTSLASAGCRGPVTSFGTYGLIGDEPAYRHRRLRDDVTTWVEGPLFAPIEVGRVVWGEDGGLTLEPSDGDSSSLLDVSKKARLVARGSGAALFAVDESPALFVTPEGTAVPLDATLRLPRFPPDVPYTTAYPTVGELVVVSDVDGFGIAVDMTSGAMRRVVGSYHRVVGRNIVSMVSGRVVSTEFSTGTTRTLFDGAIPVNSSIFGYDVARDDSLVLAGLWIDMDGRVAPLAGHEFHGLSTDGRVLCSPTLSDGEPLVFLPVPQGPLRWHEARPVDSGR